MKILELRFKNLNSLYGEWRIDFTNPEYIANGIFALTGPTGAGKSTILDAICLALYGATPRLGKITESNNEIMSRQSSECYAEVLFESQAGRFRCTWRQRRAHKKTDGKLQGAHHEIADADTGTLLESKKSLVGGVIEEKTGMDFERFTRSILLAQGEFDTFLKANAEQKSKILEQITGTEIYSKISRRVHERKRGEDKKLELLDAETCGILILTPAQEKDIQNELAAKQQQEKEHAHQLTATGNAITWLTTIEDLQKEILGLADEAAKLKIDIEAFKPEQDKLEQASRASSLDGTYATLTALRKQQTDDLATLKIDEVALPALELSATAQEEALKNAEKHTLSAKQALKTATPLIQKIRLLDQNIAEQTTAVSDDEALCTHESAKIKTNQQTQRQEQEKRVATQNALDVAARYLKIHAADEWLISGLAGVDVQLSHLSALHQDIRTQADALNQTTASTTCAEQALTDCHQAVEAGQQTLATLQHDLQRSQAALAQLLGDKLLREYRAEKESLLREKAFINTIKALEEHRAQLEDNKPCPLCGSTQHPFAEGNVPPPNAIEHKIASLTTLIDKADEQEAAIKKLEQAEIAARQNLNDNEKRATETANQQKANEKSRAVLKDSLTKLEYDFEQLQQAVTAKLQPLGITAIAASEVKALLEALKLRQQAWQQQAQRKTDLDKQMAGIDSELKRLDAIIDTQHKALVEKQEKLEQLKKALTARREERKQLYGAKMPDDEERRLTKAIADAEAVEKKTRDLNTEHQQTLTTAKTHLNALRTRMAHRAPDLQTAETHFLTALMPAAGFADEKTFLNARLSVQERESLAARAKALDDAEITLHAKQQDREARLATERTKRLTDKTLEELEPQFKAYEESLKTLREEVAGLKHTLNDNKTAEERKKKKQSVIETQKKECQRWKQLHSLIGSAEGQEYRNFAQGLTFEVMVAQANRQLEKMTDRYLLIRDEQQPLELNVIDNYQAGEIRSTKNLSGGESFIISLTLALGLSAMASQRVRVDSLFLDEGFGTLDEEALEIALDTLSRLQQSGKLIGIISHVAELKERISTQINIIPVSGGRSSLFGPGCSRQGE